MAKSNFKAQVTPSNDEDDNRCPAVSKQSGEQSDVARAVERLKAASFRAARERERVPQPLFWSLFATELESIKRRKLAKRVLEAVFDTPDE